MPHVQPANPTEKSFVFVFENLPPHVAWKELKDLIRKTASVGLGRAEVPILPGGHTGGHGWIPIKLEKNSKKLFKTLRDATIDGHRLRLHYFETTDTGDEFRDCNCRYIGHKCPQHTTSMAKAIIAAAPTHNYTSGISYLVDAHRAPLTPPQSPQNPAPTAYASPVTPSPYSYRTQRSQINGLHSRLPSTSFYNPRSPASYTLPVNTSTGFLQTQSTRILIKGLSYSTSADRLMSFLVHHGCKPLRVKLYTDSHGRSTGSAVADLHSLEWVRYAVAVLDKQMLDGRVIGVKADRNGDVVGGGAINSGYMIRGAGGKKKRESQKTQPLVIDGSAGRREASS